MSGVKEFESFEKFLSSVEEGDFVTCTYSDDGVWFKEGNNYEVLCVEEGCVTLQDEGGDESSYEIDEYNWNNCCRFGIEQKEQIVLQPSTKQRRVALAKKYREVLDMYYQAASMYQQAQDALYEAEAELEKYGLSVEEQVDNSVVIKYSPPTEVY